MALWTRRLKTATIFSCQIYILLGGHPHSSYFHVLINIPMRGGITNQMLPAASCGGDAQCRDCVVAVEWSDSHRSPQGGVGRVRGPD